MKPTGQRPARIILLIVLLAPLLYARYIAVFPSGKIHTFCLFRMITTIPCPFCHGTTSWALMSIGHFGEAFGANPLGAVLFVIDAVAVLWLITAVIFDFKPLPASEWTGKKPVWGAGLGFAALSWFYLILERFGIV